MSAHVEDATFRVVTFPSLKENWDSERESPYKDWHELMREAADWMERNPRHFLRGIDISSSDQGEWLVLRLKPMPEIRGLDKLDEGDGRG